MASVTASGYDFFNSSKVPRITLNSRVHAPHGHAWEHLAKPNDGLAVLLCALSLYQWVKIGQIGLPCWKVDQSGVSHWTGNTEVIPSYSDIGMLDRRPE